MICAFCAERIVGYDNPRRRDDGQQAYDYPGIMRVTGAGWAHSVCYSRAASLGRRALAEVPR